MPNLRNNNRFLRILLKHLKTLDSDPKPTINDVCDYMGIQQKSLNTYFPNPRNSKYCPAPFTKRFIRQLYLGFRIPVREFLLSDQEFQLYTNNETLKKKASRLLFLKKEDLISDWSVTADVIEFKHLDYETQMTADKIEDFLEKYKNIINRQIPKVDNLIAIYEYLGKGNIREPVYLGVYNQAHDDIFKTIEHAIRNSDSLMYTRYLALPHNSLNGSRAYDFDECAKKVLTECSLVVFKHICRCLYEFSVANTQKTVRFYLVPEPLWPYNVGIINTEQSKKDRYLMSEYFRYSTRSGVLLPNLLFVERVQSRNTKVLHEMYRSELHLYSIDHKDRYFQSYEHFSECFDKAYKAVCSSENNGLKENGILKSMEAKKAFIHQMTSA